MPNGALLFFAVASVVAAIAHWRIPRYLIASGVTALVSPFAFALVCSVLGARAHWAEPRLFLIFACAALLTALVVGLAFLVPRRLARRKATNMNGTGEPR